MMLARHIIYSRHRAMSSKTALSAALDVQTLHRVWLTMQPRLPLVLSIGLLLLLAWLAAGLTWQLLPAPAPGSTAQPPSLSSPGAATESRPNDDVNRLIGYHLFGVPDAAPAAAVVDAPETRLNLVLRGVAAAADQELSRAIIASGNEEQTYAIGDAVPGGATLQSVLPDRVILRRAGRLETLTLPREASPGVEYTPPASSVEEPAERSLTEVFARDPVTPPTMPANKLRALREEILNNPVKLTDIVRPQPVFENDQQIGYRLYPGPEQDRFRALGLQSGDLVTAINGTALNDPAQGLQLLQQLDDMQTVTLTIRRDGQEQQLSLSTQ